MIDEVWQMRDEYDDILLKPERTQDDYARLDAIEARLVRMFGYDWTQQYLAD